MRVLRACLWLVCALVVAAQNEDDPLLAEGTLAEAFSEGLKQQTLRALETHGESITIMVVGESGLGKTSLLSSIFRTELVWPEGNSNGQPTQHIVEQTVSFDLEGVPFSARLVDTPGYGDSDLQREFGVVIGRLNAGFRRMLLLERRISRPDKRQREQQGCVDVVLYFFAPHRCKRADIALLKQLHQKASIVPILAKADSMTTDELAAFRQEVVHALIEAKVRTDAVAPRSLLPPSRARGSRPLAPHAPLATRGATCPPPLLSPSVDRSPHRSLQRTRQLPSSPPRGQQAETPSAGSTRGGLPSPRAGWLGTSILSSLRCDAFC
jgi:hypothetical protein